MSYAPEVIADDSGTWCGNALRFETEAEAEVWVADLSMRWMLVRDTRVVTSEDPVNSQLLKTGDGRWEYKNVDHPTQQTVRKG